ncbi:MAG TPA: hypothetical protein VEH29_01625, partial [Acidimicrobiales bacterium]|nr:hypothetical protein [Acidimicrobiales bacterium]
MSSLALVLAPATLAVAACRAAYASLLSTKSQVSAAGRGLRTAAGRGGTTAGTAVGSTSALTKGQVHIVLGTPSGDHGAITVGPINNMAEGDSVSRVVELTNNTTVGAAGTTGLASVAGL